MDALRRRDFRGFEQAMTDESAIIAEQARLADTHVAAVVVMGKASVAAARRQLKKR